MEDDDLKARVRQIGKFFEELPKPMEPKLSDDDSSDDYPLIIPSYQRPYSWDNTICDKLFDDLTNFIELNKENKSNKEGYFLGTIILNSSNNHLYLIDGQQRTTTFYLMFKALLLCIIKKIPTLAGDNESEGTLKTFKSLAERLSKILYFVEDEDISSKNLLLGKEDKWKENYDFLKNRKIPIKNESINEEENNKKDFTVIIHSTSYEEIEKNVHKKPRMKLDNRKFTKCFLNFKYFYEKLKGLDANPLKIFTKTLLDNCRIIEIKCSTVSQAIAMFNSLNSTGLPLSDADILSANLYSKCENKKEFEKQWKGLMEESEALGDNRFFHLQNLFTEYMYYLRAIDGIDSVTLNSVRTYFLEDKKEIKPNETISKLQNLVDNWEKLKEKPLVKLLLKLNFNSNFFLSNYFLSHSDLIDNDDESRRFLELLLKLFIILEIDETGYSSKKFKSFLFKENTKFVDPKVDLDELCRDFNDHIKCNWDKEDIEKRCLEGYRKNLLVFVNEYLFCKEKGKVFDFKDNVNIEHIMPNSGKNIDSIREDAKIKDENEFNDLVNKLGNKILLEENINKRIGNAWFKQKKSHAIKEKNGYVGSEYKIAEALTDFPSDKWTKKDIDECTDKANKRIIDFIFGS